MKKILFGILLSAILMVGCSKEEAKDADFSGDKIEVEESADNASDADNEENDKKEEKEEDVMPEEGMVRSALTNEWVDEEVANARPIAVMMPTDEAAQPQYGIGNAEILYEVMEEGDISRQLAVINNWQELKKIGNIRSCRLYYIPLAMEWDSIMVHFGGVYYMRDRVMQPDFNNISGTYTDGTPETSAPGAGAFFRDSNKAAPHNAYVSAKSLTKKIDELGYSFEHRGEYYEENHFNFSNKEIKLDEIEQVTAIDANTVDLSNVFPVTKSKLVYNEEDGLYYKELYGKKQIDAGTDEQLSFKNIIVQSTYYEHAQDPDGPSKYLVFQMHDSTRDGYYITNGKAIKVTWKKEGGDYAPTRYYDENGDEIVMNTGKTYIAVAQYDTNVILE